MTRQGFRRLFIISWLVGLTAVAVSMLTVSYLPPDLRDYVEAQSNAEPTTKDWVVFTVGVCLLIGYIITSVGLYRFRAWAKTLFLPMNIIALLMMPLYGPSVMTGWASAFNCLNCLVGGGVLFLVYLSPVGQMFGTDGDV
jgi:hypothetical protein